MEQKRGFRMIAQIARNVVDEAKRQHLEHLEGVVRLEEELKEERRAYLDGLHELGPGALVIEALEELRLGFASNVGGACHDPNVTTAIALLEEAVKLERADLFEAVESLRGPSS